MPANGADGVRPVDPDPYRFRTGRRALLVEAGVLALLGGAGVTVSLAVAGPGAAVVGFVHLTMLHSVVLLVTGLLGLAATFRRRTALAFTGARTVGDLLLFVIGVTLAARGVPTAMGFDTTSTVMNGAVAVVGLALSMWFAGRVLEGRWWIRRGART